MSTSWPTWQSWCCLSPSYYRFNYQEKTRYLVSFSSLPVAGCKFTVHVQSPACSQLTVCSVCVATIGRTCALAPFRGSFEQIDFTWSLVPELNWAIVEGSVGIIAASLPSLKPLVKRLRCKRTRGGRGGGNDRSSLHLRGLSDGGKRAEAQQLQNRPSIRQPTLRHGPADEELGLCPAPTTEGSVRMSSFSRKSVLNGSFRGGFFIETGDTESKLRPGIVDEVRKADFAVASSKPLRLHSLA